MNLEIIYGGCYSRPETNQQKLKCYMLYLAISGFNYMHFYNRSGDRMESPISISGDTPFLALLPPDICIDFSTNRRRENWAILFNSADIKTREDSFCSTLNQIKLESFKMINQRQIVQLRNLFSEISDNFSSGHPAGIEKAKLLMGALMTELMPSILKDSSSDVVAGAMKRAIDEDVGFRYSLEELNKQLNLCSMQTMRKRFEAEYGILPAKYRGQLRMNRVLELFSKTDFSLKKISDEVGMRHIEHLYAFLKERQRLSPKELLLQFRGEK